MMKSTFNLFKGLLFGLLVVVALLHTGLATASTLQPKADGTVYDSATGLTWMRCAIGQTWTGSTCSGIATTYNFNQVNASTVTEPFAGQSDWRMPNIRELQTIVDRSVYNPAIDSAAFPNTQSSSFWSGSPTAKDSFGAWVVAFNNGYAYSTTRYSNGAVRLVRGGQSFGPLLDISRPTNDYVDHGNGTVTHTPTKLTWMRCAMGQTWTGNTCSGTAKSYYFDEANALTDTTPFADQSDWRLPTEEELLSLVDYASQGLAINTSMFLGITQNREFWSNSSPCAGDSNRVWHINFYDGATFCRSLNGGGYAVRLVRGGQSFVSAPVCTLTASQTSITAGGTSTLTADCPTATSYVWTGGTCAGKTGSTCTVSPLVTTTYTVAGINAGGTGATKSVTVTVTSSNPTALTNGQTVANLSGATDSTQFFYIDVPSGATSLTVETSGGSGDADLYVLRGSAPTTTTYDCRSFTDSSSVETCSFPSTTAALYAGRYYILLHGYGSFNGVSLTATYAGGNSLPDLVVSSLTAPATGTVGKDIAIAATVTNQGTASAGAYKLGLYLSDNSSITPIDPMIGSCNMSSLASGASHNCTGDVTIPDSFAAGNYYFGAIADVLGVVSESDVGNNTKAVPIVLGTSVTAPVCTLTASSTSITAGGTSTLTASCPTATSYVWTGGTCEGKTGATCTVTPSATMTYTVAGINAGGTGATKSVTVTVTSVSMGPCDSTAVKSITPNGYAFANNYKTFQAFEVTCANGRYGGIRLPHPDRPTEVETCAFQQSSCQKDASMCLSTPDRTSLMVISNNRNGNMATLLADPVIGQLANWICQ